MIAQFCDWGQLPSLPHLLLRPPLRPCKAKKWSWALWGPGTHGTHRRGARGCLGTHGTHGGDATVSKTLPAKD